ncbi:hypothetical protein KKG72_06065 [bacterium]|nr:hypothetical protein [bacterium]MBU1993663.1 hypothetical protein [bacterium]
MNLFKTSFLLLTAFFFIACGDNTETPITADVSSISIDQTNPTIRSTDAFINLTASAQYTDGTSADATTKVNWTNSNYNVVSMLGGAVEAVANGGESNVSISYADFQDTQALTVHKLTSFFISSADINTTGVFPLEAKGNFDNNETNITLVKNIVWTANNGATISIADNIASITIYVGDTNITATVFKETNTSSPIAPITKTYTVN